MTPEFFKLKSELQAFQAQKARCGRDLVALDAAARAGSSDAAGHADRLRKILRCLDLRIGQKMAALKAEGVAWPLPSRFGFHRGGMEVTVFQSVSLVPAAEGAGAPPDAGGEAAAAVPEAGGGGPAAAAPEAAAAVPAPDFGFGPGTPLAIPEPEVLAPTGLRRRDVVPPIEPEPEEPRQPTPEIPDFGPVSPFTPYRPQGLFGGGRRLPAGRPALALGPVFSDEEGTPPYWGEWGIPDPEGYIVDGGRVGPFPSRDEAFRAAGREARKAGARRMPHDGFAQVVDTRGRAVGPVT